MSGIVNKLPLNHDGSCCALGGIQPPIQPVSMSKHALRRFSISKKGQTLLINGVIDVVVIRNDSSEREPSWIQSRSDAWHNHEQTCWNVAKK